MMPPQQQTAPRRLRGLTRTEWIWTVLLLGVILMVILVTLDAEVERGMERMDRDTLSHLASAVHLGLERQGVQGPDDLAEPLPLLGPGTAPADADGTVTGGALVRLMPDGFTLPTDPWGGAYVLMAHGPSEVPSLYLVSGGGDGILPEELNPMRDDVVQVFWRIDQPE